MRPTWTLRPQQYTPDDGHFANVEMVLVTTAAMRKVGRADIAAALAALATASTTRRLDHLQVLERNVDGVRLYAIDDGDAVTILLPDDW